MPRKTVIIQSDILAREMDEGGRGFQIKTIRICFLSRNGEMRDDHVIFHALSPQVRVSSWNYNFLIVDGFRWFITGQTEEVRHRQFNARINWLL